MERLKEFIAELGNHYLLDQLLAQLPSAPVRQDDFPIVGYRNGAGTRQRRGRDRSDW